MKLYLSGSLIYSIDNTGVGQSRLTVVMDINKTIINK